MQVRDAAREEVLSSAQMHEVHIYACRGWQVRDAAREEVLSSAQMPLRCIDRERFPLSGPALPPSTSRDKKGGKKEGRPEAQLGAMDVAAMEPVMYVCMYACIRACMHMHV